MYLHSRTSALELSRQGRSTITKATHFCITGARGWLVLAHDGGHIHLHHAAVVLRHQAQDQVGSQRACCLGSSGTVSGTKRYPNLDGTPPRIWVLKHRQLHVCPWLQVFICRFFESTRRQLGDLLRVRHPKVADVFVKPEPALAGARGKLYL